VRERSAQADEVERSKVSWEKYDAVDSSERMVLRVREDVQEEVGVLMPTLDLFIFDKSSESWERYPAKFHPSQMIARRKSRL